MPIPNKRSLDPGTYVDVHVTVYGNVMNVVIVVYLFRCWYYIRHVVILCTTILTYIDYMELRNKQKTKTYSMYPGTVIWWYHYDYVLSLYIFFTYIHTHVFKTRTRVIHKRLERVVEKGVCVLPNALGWESKALRFPWWKECHLWDENGGGWWHGLDREPPVGMWMVLRVLLSIYWWVMG